jgi:hypothetical protein
MVTSSCSNRTATAGGWSSIMSSCVKRWRAKTEFSGEADALRDNIVVTYCDGCMPCGTKKLFCRSGDSILKLVAGGLGADAAAAAPFGF